MKKRQTPAIIVISSACLVALFLRILFPQTIEFGFDQPRLASLVLRLLSHPSFISVQEVVEQNPWGSYSWGMWQVMFWVPFFLISSHPVVISQMVSVVGVMGIFLYGFSLLNIPGGIFAGLLVATHFWIHIFSREIYQPTPVFFETVLGMALTIALIKKRKTWLAVLSLPFFAIMVSTYIPTVVWTGGTVLFLIAKKVYTPKTFFGGLILAALVLSPTILFHIKHPESVKNYYARQGFVEHKAATSMVVFPQFLRTVSGGNIEWQIGNGIQEFLDQNPWYSWYETTQMMLACVVLFYHIRKIIGNRKEHIRLIFLFWTVASAAFVAIIGFEYIVPRYFLVGIPAYLALTAWMFQELLKKHPVIFGAVIIMVANIQSIVILRYYDFALTYHYPSGFMSYFSDTPVVYLENTFEWMKNDAAARGFRGYTVESSIHSINYYQQNVYSQRSEDAKYSVEYRSQGDNPSFVSGPYAVTRL